MKTVALAVGIFFAAFASVFVYGHYMAPTPEQAAIEAQFKDALVEELGHPPEPEQEPGTQTVGEGYRALQRAFVAMNKTCSPEARKGYALAFAQYIEAVDRANESHASSDEDVDGTAVMNQFLDVSGRHIIEAADMPSWRFRRMVAAVADSNDNPSEDEKRLRARMQLTDWYRNDAGDAMQPSPCKPLTEEG